MRSKICSIKVRIIFFCSYRKVDSFLGKKCLKKIPFVSVIYPITRTPIEAGPECQVKDKAIKLDKFQLISM